MRGTSLPKERGPQMRPSFDFIKKTMFPYFNSALILRFEKRFLQC